MDAVYVVPDTFLRASRRQVDLRHVDRVHKMLKIKPCFSLGQPCMRNAVLKFHA